jgi:hypothetical protein
MRRLVETEMVLTTARTAVVATALFGCACARPHYRLTPIPLAQPPAWATVFSAPGFTVAADTQHVENVASEHALLIWVLTRHDETRQADSLRFNRSRIRLLVRCHPLSFRSVSQELALGDAPPISHTEWPWTGPKAPAWRMPESGATDDRFLRQTCADLGQS